MVTVSVKIFSIQPPTALTRPPTDFMPKRANCQTFPTAAQRPSGRSETGTVDMRRRKNDKVAPQVVS